jgi:hypothetical protein
MAHAYTPGLKVLSEAKVRKERRLPLKGSVVVEQGARVDPDSIVARTNLPGNVRMVNIANMLSISPADINDVMKIKVGDSVTQGQKIAETQGLFGFFKSRVDSPVIGTLENISNITGQIVLREPPKPVEIDAYINGRVVGILPEEGVRIETDAAFIQGIFGIGGENRGILKIAVASRTDELTEDRITPDMAGRIVVGGSFMTLATYKKAIRMKVSAVVVGGFNYQDLEDVLGYKLGVAITGSEDLGTSLIVTEGYGRIAMSHRTFDLLKEHDGRFASVNGATQIRAGVIRPEIVIPLAKESLTGPNGSETRAQGIQTGSLVRVIRAPHFGKFGKVVELPPQLQMLESETMVRVAVIEVDDGTITVPRSNLEIVETDT